MVLEKTLERPWDSKEIKPVNPKGNQSWIFIGRTDAEAKTPILWSPDVKSLINGKDPDAGKDWRQEKKGMIEDEMVGWHHRLNGHEFEQTLEIVKDREAWCSAAHGVTKSWTQLGDWTTTKTFPVLFQHYPHWGTPGSCKTKISNHSFILTASSSSTT